MQHRAARHDDLGEMLLLGGRDRTRSMIPVAPAFVVERCAELLLELLEPLGRIAHDEPVAGDDA